jgi:hypothetical protein
MLLSAMIRRQPLGKGRELSKRIGKRGKRRMRKTNVKLRTGTSLTKLKSYSST